MAAGILLSRIAGLVRERVFAHYLGNSDAAGAFKAALRIPNFLQNLFGEGVLSASFIPVYARLLAEKDDKTAGRVAGVVATLLALAVSVIVAIGVLATPAIIGLVAPGFQGEVRELTVRIVRILFPGVGLLVMSAWCLGVLNSHHKFFLSYVAPVLWNIAMIATLVIFGARLGQYPLAIALAWGAVVGSALQFGMQVPFVFRYAPEIRFGLQTSLAPVRSIFRNLGPVVVSRGVVQLSAYIDGMIASFLGTNAVSGLGYAQTIYLLPIGLFGMSVAASELPRCRRRWGRRTRSSPPCARASSGAAQIAFFVIPSVAASWCWDGHSWPRCTGRGRSATRTRATSGTSSSARRWACWPRPWDGSTRRPSTRSATRGLRCASRSSASPSPAPSVTSSPSRCARPWWPASRPRACPCRRSRAAHSASAPSASRRRRGWRAGWSSGCCDARCVTRSAASSSQRGSCWAWRPARSPPPPRAGVQAVCTCASPRGAASPPPISAAVVIVGITGVAYFLARSWPVCPEAKRTIGRLL